MADAETLPARDWIPISAAGFLGTIANLYILHKELHHATTSSSENDRFAKMNRILSIGCMVSGVSTAFWLCLSYLPIICNFGNAVISISFALQAGSMSYYQLLRLYYCISRDKVHSSMGYPTCVFTIMSLLGVLLIINTLIYPWFITNFALQCGIDAELAYYPRGSTLGGSWKHGLWASLSIVLTAVWDLIILALFCYKVLQFHFRHKSVTQSVRHRVMSILNRILILTLFYQYAALLFLLVAGFGLLSSLFLYSILGALTQCICVAMTVSMYLMQPHNSQQYVTFLRTLYGYKLYYVACCCCCKAMIRNDLELQLAIYANMTVSDTNTPAAAAGVGDGNNKAGQHSMQTMDHDIVPSRIKQRELSVSDTLELQKQSP